MQQSIIVRERTERIPWKRGPVSTPLVKALQKVSGTWERDYTHDFYPGPNFFPHADSWSVSDGKCCTMQP